MGSFDGKVAVVTGAGSGIGRELAISLARRGAHLAISDVNEEGLNGTAQRVGAIGEKPHLEVLDVSDRSAVQRYRSSVVAHHGTVHQIYNNAGVAGGAAAVVECDYEAYERVIAINLWGVINGTKEFLPHLIESGDGHVINISSLNGLMAQASMSHIAQRNSRCVDSRNAFGQRCSRLATQCRSHWFIRAASKRTSPPPPLPRPRVRDGRSPTHSANGLTPTTTSCSKCRRHARPTSTSKE
jgi:NAD(P)-dependent dehydrogenase (short-subunit alcohol dehydrogenase family)